MKAPWRIEDKTVLCSAEPFLIIRPEPLLRHTVSRCDQTVIGKVCFASFGLNRSQNGSHGKERSAHDEVQDLSKF